MLSRNVNSQFSRNPTVSVSRSAFDRSSSLKTSFNVGDIVPFYVDEVLPGDTFDVKSSKVVRLQTLLTPVMDNLYLDTYYYFVPNRLVWEHWQQFCGENTESAWIPSVEYAVPQITAPPVIPPAGDDPGHLGGWDIGTIADYMGIPPGVPGLSVNALPFRAYAMICNEWFRDQNLSDPLNVPVSDATVVGVNTDSYITDVVKGGKPFKAAKYHDYFTSCLPAPQKGPDVTIPVSQGAMLPVVPRSDIVDTSMFDGTRYNAYFLGSPPTPGVAFYGLGFADTGVQGSGRPGASGDQYPIINNLWAVDDGLASTATINQLRMAFQIQKIYEKDARGGTRYIELLKSHFGVTSPDSRLQRPEYLGGNRLPITISQVVQQSETGGTPQGNTAGYSLTTDVNSDFKRSFVEHGFVIGVMVARYPHTYQQGLERFWSRSGRFDYYWPVLANIGEQVVKNQEIYAQGTSADAEVFGYQEAWADYRYKPNRVSGEMRSQYAQSLDVWHFGDDYESQPYLSDEWIRESAINVDRTLAVTSQLSNQLIADIYVRNRSVRPMPVNSIPGLIDHH